MIPWELHTAGQTAKQELNSLISSIDEHSTKPDRKKNQESDADPLIKFMFYFDNAEVLGLRRSRACNGDTLLDVLTSSLTFLTGSNAFFMLITTNPFAGLLAPPKQKLSSHAQRYFEHMVHPFFGGQIDYFLKKPDWEKVLWDQLSEVDFLAQFGRAL